MTIAAQHVRTALSHLRRLHPAWKSILKAVGPFTVRIERQPAWWLTRNLHCRSFRDFAVVRNSFDSPDFWLVLCHNQNLGTSEGGRSQLCEAPAGPFRQLTPDPFTRPTPKLNADKARDYPANETGDPSREEVQRQFWTELESAQRLGTLDLALPTSPAELAERTAALTPLLERYGSTIGDRFQFYCWGLLDSWPSSDLTLLQVVTEQFLGADTNAASGLADSFIDAWSPYRSIAAWYLEQWALRSEDRSACSNPI